MEISSMVMGLMQGSVQNSDSLCLKLHQLSFPIMLTLSICCGLFFNTIFAKENPYSMSCVD